MNRSPSLTQLCADKLKLLADPTRLGVVEALLDGPARVGELEQRLGVEQSLMSHHLRILREAGLVAAEREGKGVLYRLAPGVGVRGSRPAIDLGCCRVLLETRSAARKR